MRLELIGLGIFGNNARFLGLDENSLVVYQQMCKYRLLIFVSVGI